jgi:RimJ/RimL family protein N-acetyltransferase
MKRLEYVAVHGRDVANAWGSDPNLRADIKRDIAEHLAMMMRTHDLIDYVVTTAENGDTVVIGSVNVERTGDEH